MSEETWNKIEERKKLINKHHNAQYFANKSTSRSEYDVKDKEVKKSTGKDKREYNDNLAEKAQRAADFGNMKIMNNITKQLSGMYNKNSVKIVL